jgi:MGT family glycosyltransferase
MPGGSLPQFSVPFILRPESGDERLPAWIGSLPAQATVYLTLGTSSLINTRPSVMRAFIDGLANEPLNLIVTVGRNNDPAELGPGPSNVWIERYIPQTLLFPHCALVICHAGSGTVMAALVHGLPLVLVPIAADQPQNARRCDALGLAMVLDVDRLDPTITRTAVCTVLADPSYRQHAETVRAEIKALPGPEQAVIYLERLAAHQDLRLCYP